MDTQLSLLSHQLSFQVEKMVELHHHPAAGNLTILRGKCIEPFLDVSQFGQKGGRKRAYMKRSTSFAEFCHRCRRQVMRQN